MRADPTMKQSNQNTNILLFHRPTFFIIEELQCYDDCRFKCSAYAAAAAIPSPHWIPLDSYQTPSRSPTIDRPSRCSSSVLTPIIPDCNRNHLFYVHSNVWRALTSLPRILVLRFRFAEWRIADIRLAVECIHVLNGLVVIF